MGAGRQREFDKANALETAMELFWRDGYNGTSLSDLTAAMGINKPSLYAAFGNKEALFVSALNQYILQYGAPHIEWLHAPGIRLELRLQNYLKSIAKMVTDPKLPGGCFVTTSTCEAGRQCLPPNAVGALKQINEASIEAFIDFFQQEKHQGHMDEEASPELWANYLLALQFGLAVMGRSGTKKNVLESIIKHSISIP